MIRQKTLFVIGAGAGFDVDMPLGSKLSEEIAQRLISSSPTITRWNRGTET
jgi:hypothetical protein